MSSAQYNWITEQGATQQRVFRNLDINGVQIPFIAGSVATFSVKLQAGITGASVILARSNDARLTLTPAGVITMTFSSYDTEWILLPDVAYVYDLFVMQPSGSNVRFLSGSINPYPSVTAVLNG